MAHPLISRRALLTGVAALAAPAGSRARTRLDALDLWGPPAGPSITLAHAVATEMFADVADAATMSAWRSPDELRAGLTSGRIMISVVPVQAAARLYNKGFPIRLANVMTNGLLYVLSGDDGVSAIPDLAGKRVAAPFRGDVPEILFSQLLAHHGLTAGTDVEISYAGSPIEAMQLLLAGRVDAALTAEPAASAGIAMAKQGGKSLRRAISIQRAFGEMTGAAPVVPQAGLAVTQRFLDVSGEALPAILDIIAAATGQVTADPQKAASGLATETLGLPAPLLAASVPTSNLVARPAQEARADIERMLSAMGRPDFANLGGRLPDSGFYL